MTTGQRIMLNALAAYTRTMFAMVLGLFSSRWLLASLGQVDYGLMTVVGSLIGFIGFLNTISTTACARFFALSIGRKDFDETNWWFNTALSIHIVLPSVLLLIGWPIGEWAIDNFLSIPLNRLNTAHWVFRLSLVSAFCWMSSTPFTSMFTAKQNIVESSFWGMTMTLSNFFMVLWLTTYKGDTWLVYCVCTVCISIFFCTVQIYRAIYKFPECTINLKRWYCKNRIIDVFSYAGWTILGGLGYMFYNQGISIVLNKFFPPLQHKSVNASYSVGGALAGYTRTLSGSLMNAFLPEIVSSEGRGDRNAVHHQVYRACRLGFCVISVFAIPLLVEADFVLRIWLKNPPEYAALFCRTFLLCFLLSRLVGGYDAAICATGRIKWYQIILSSFSISSVFIVAFVLFLGGGIIGVCATLLIFEIINDIGNVYFGYKLVGLRLSEWFRNVFCKVGLSTFISLAITVIINCLWMSDFVIIHLLKCVISFFTTSITCWYILIYKEERKQLKKGVIKIKNKLTEYRNAQ